MYGYFPIYQWSCLRFTQPKIDSTKTPSLVILSREKPNIEFRIMKVTVFVLLGHSSFDMIRPRGGIRIEYGKAPCLG